MTNLSPHERGKTANRSNKLAMMLIVTLLAIAFLFAYQGYDASPTTPASVPPTALEADGYNMLDGHTFDASDDWTEQFEQLTSDAGGRSLQIIRTFDRSKVALLKQVSTTKVSPDSDFGKQIVAKLGELGRLPNDDADIRDTIGNSAIDLGSVASSIRQVVDRRVKQEQADLESVIDSAIEQAKHDRANELRTASLKLRDAEDAVATDRLQIHKAETDRGDEKARAARLAALQRDMVDVRAYLIPFITPGHVQPDSLRSAGNIRHTLEAMPVSLVELERIGALVPSLKGLEILHRAACASNDRPHASFPIYALEGGVTRRDVRPFVEKAQALLRQHGQALVEANLLSR